jgi:hypothetical protein
VMTKGVGSFAAFMLRSEGATGCAGICKSANGKSCSLCPIICLEQHRPRILA